MANDNDTIAYLQYAARELPVPRFGKPYDIRGGNTKTIRNIAFSCDGKKAATGTEYKGIRIWNATQPMEAAGSYSLPRNVDSSPHNGHVATMAFSPVEPDVLVSGCRSAQGGPVVVVWDISKPSSSVASFKVPGDILHIAFHPNGSHFAVTCTRGLRDEAFFFWRSAETGVWTQREDIGLSGALGAVESEEINSLRFTQSGRLICAVSNDGSANAWLYPTELVSRSPSPEIGQETTAPETGAEADDTREDDERKSRAVSPEEDRPEEPTKEGESEAVTSAVDTDATAANGDGQAADKTEAEDNKAEDGKPTAQTEQAQDVEMAEAGTGDAAPVDSPANAAGSATEPSNGDVEMSSSQAPVASSTPPAAASVAPSRQPSPPSTKPPAPKRSKAKPLKCVRHTICHSASLLSLSFDPAGKFMAIGGQDALLSLFDTQDWICQRTFDMFTAAIRHSAFSPDGELIALAGDDTFIAIVSVYSKQMIAKIPVNSPVIALAWHSHHNWLAYCTSRSGVTWHMCCQES